MGWQIPSSEIYRAPGQRKSRKGCLVLGQTVGLVCIWKVPREKTREGWGWEYGLGRTSPSSRKGLTRLINCIWEEIYDCLQILLLSGPPGLGKTTLAHVVARQAGYEVMEINARSVDSISCDCLLTKRFVPQWCKDRIHCRRPSTTRFRVRLCHWQFKAGSTCDRRDWRCNRIRW